MDLQISPFPNQFLYTRSKPDEFEHSFATYFDTKASETNASPVDEAKAVSLAELTHFPGPYFSSALYKLTETGERRLSLFVCSLVYELIESSKHKIDLYIIKSTGFSIQQMRKHHLVLLQAYKYPSILRSSIAL